MVVGDTRRCWDQLSRHCSRDGDSQVVLDKLRRQKQVITTIVRNKVPCWSSPSNDRQLWCLETKENLVLVFGRRWCLVQTRCSSEAASFSSSAAFKAMKQLLRQQLKATQVEPLLRAPSSSFKLLETPSYTLMYTPSWTRPSMPSLLRHPRISRTLSWKPGEQEDDILGRNLCKEWLVFQLVLKLQQDSRDSRSSCMVSILVSSSWRVRSSRAREARNKNMSHLNDRTFKNDHHTRETTQTTQTFSRLNQNRIYCKRERC